MKQWYSQIADSDDPHVRQALAQALLSRRPPEPPDQVGRLVEFVRGRECRMGVVRKQGGRHGTLGVFDLEGKERTVEVGRILDFSRRQLPLGDGAQLRLTLRRIDRSRARRLAGLDLHTLWEVVVGDGEEWWDLEILVDLYFAEAPADDERAALVRALAGGSYFEMRQGRFKPHPQAVVERKRAVESARQRSEAELVQQAAWLRGLADGKEGPAPSTAERAIALLEEAALGQEDRPLSPAATQLMRRAHLHGPLAALEILVRLGRWGADENLDLRRAGLASVFAPGLVCQATDARWPKAAARSRRWWGRQSLGWSEEGEACQTVFSMRRGLRGYRLGIHCAIPGLLAGDGDLTTEALSRGVALELPDRRLGLLPPELEEQVLFRVGQRRPALTLVVQLDRALAVRSYAFRLSRVRLIAAAGAQDTGRAAAAGRLAVAARKRGGRAAGPGGSGRRGWCALVFGRIAPPGRGPGRGVVQWARAGGGLPDPGPAGRPRGGGPVGPGAPARAGQGPDQARLAGGPGAQ